MKESIGYTVTLNLVIVFVAIIFTFLSAALIYFKSNKVTNIVVNSLEKYEGYNSLSEEEMNKQIASIGYQVKAINCKSTVRSGGTTCELKKQGTRGYCIYECNESEEYYYYRVRINMMLNVPIINNILDIPIYSNTNRMYDFESSK